MVYRIITSNMKVTSKFTIFAYVFTYYAIAMALPLSLAMYLITGWFGDDWQMLRSGGDRRRRSLGVLRGQ